MGYILIWLSIGAPVNLGDYATQQACMSARAEVAAMASPGATLVANVSFPAVVNMPKPDTSPEGMAKAMICVPKG